MNSNTSSTITITVISNDGVCYIHSTDTTDSYDYSVNYNPSPPMQTANYITSVMYYNYNYEEVLELPPISIPTNNPKSSQYNNSIELVHFKTNQKNSIIIFNNVDNTNQSVESFNYISCNSINNTPTSFTGITGTTKSTGITLSVTTEIPFSTPPTCDSYTETPAPVNESSYATTYTFGFSNSVSVEIILNTTYNNSSWTINGFTINNYSATKAQIAIAIGSLCSMFYALSYQASTTKTSNLLVSIACIAPIIQLYCS